VHEEVKGGLREVWSRARGGVPEGAVENGLGFGIIVIGARQAAARQQCAGKLLLHQPFVRPLRRPASPLAIADSYPSNAAS
jgi:hypothetical protein